MATVFFKANGFCVCTCTYAESWSLWLLFLYLFTYLFTSNFQFTCNKIIIIISLTSSIRARDRKKKRQQPTELRQWKGRLKFCCFTFQNSGTTKFASVTRYELVSQLADWNIHPWQSLFFIIIDLFIYCYVCLSINKQSTCLCNRKFIFLKFKR